MPKCKRHPDKELVALESLKVGLVLACPINTCDYCELPAAGGSRGAGAAPAPQYGYEEQLRQQLALLDVPAPDPEFKFDPGRRWRIDLAWPALKLGVEIEGGVHRIKSRFKGDLEKYRVATLSGWTVLRYPTSMVRDGTAAVEIAQYLRGRD